MSVVSSTGLSRRAMLVMGGIFVLTLLAIIGTLMTVQDSSLAIVLSVLAPTVAAFVLVFVLRTEIAIDAHIIKIRMRPIYTKQLPIHDFETEMIAFGESLPVNDPAMADEDQFRTSCQPTAAWAWQRKATIGNIIRDVGTNS